jgi:hypothetical protein
MKAIFTLAAIGGSISSAITYSILPVVAPGEILLSANMGMASGALMGLAVKSFALESHGYSALGTVGFGVLSVLSGITSIVQSANSFEFPLEHALGEAINMHYGAEMHGLKAGHKIVMGVDLLGEDTLPVIATATTDTVVNLRATDDGKFYLKYCAAFDVARKGDVEPVDNITMCNSRYLNQKEIQGIVATLK